MLCVNQDVTLHEAARLMEENNVARVFVCKNGKVVGVVAMIDLMSAVLIMRARGEHVD
jgi:CBS domain-containing protein